MLSELIALSSCRRQRGQGIVVLGQQRRRVNEQNDAGIDLGRPVDRLCRCGSLRIGWEIASPTVAAACPEMGNLA
jgi:hypothetical protein